MRNRAVLGVPKTTPRFGDSLGRHRTRHMVVLKAKMYYSERIQSKVSKGERSMEQNPEEIKHMLPRIPAQWRTQDMLTSSSNKL